MSRPQAQGLLTASDIADLAGVSRAAVSNWRNRQDDFPEPVGGTATKPLFARAEISEWLTAHGYSVKTNDAQSAVWGAMNHLRGPLDMRDAGLLVVALLAEHATTQCLPDTYERLAQQVDPHTMKMLREVIAEVPVDQAASVADFVLERSAKSLGKMGGESGFIGSRTSAILINLATGRGRGRGVLYDPACGMATVLLGACENSDGWTRLVGHDINEASLALAAARAELHQRDIDLSQGNVLAHDPDPALVADTIVLEPPFGLRLDTDARFADARFMFGLPPRTNADTAWLQHAIAHLAPEGRAYVITPMGALFRSGQEGRIRAAMLEAGCVEAVVGLPGKMLPQTAIPLAVWVLRAPHTGADQQVLLIDASQSEDPENHIVDWLADPDAHHGVPHATITVADLIADGANLTPQRWTEQPTVDSTELAATYHHAVGQVTDLTARLCVPVSDLGPAPELAETRPMTIAELLSEGVLEQRPGKAFDRYRDIDAALEAHVVTAGMVRDHALPHPAPHGVHPDLTAPGDVLVTTMHAIRAVVDPVGGHLPGTGVTRLRITNPAVLDSDYLASMLVGEWNNDLQAGTTITRAPIKDLAIPMATLADQHKITSALAQVQQIHQLATKLARHAEDITTALGNAVRYNAPLTTQP